jgi:hypothetical protein
MNVVHSFLGLSPYIQLEIIFSLGASSFLFTCLSFYKILIHKSYYLNINTCKPQFCGTGILANFNHLAIYLPGSLQRILHLLSHNKLYLARMFRFIDAPSKTIFPHASIPHSNEEWVSRLPRRLLDLSNLFKHNPSCDILTEREHKEV